MNYIMGYLPVNGGKTKMDDGTKKMWNSRSSDYFNEKQMQVACALAALLLVNGLMLLTAVVDALCHANRLNVALAVNLN